MKKTPVFLVLLTLLTLVIPTTFDRAKAADPFTDVNGNLPSFDAVNYLKTNGVIKGYDDGSYKPGNYINRAEFVKIVVGAITSAPKGSNCFTDVKNEWFSPYVCYAKTQGIVSGYDDGSFKPASYITFSEASKVVVNALKVTKGTEGDAETWFRPYIEGLSNNKAIPLTINYFDENVTRGSMAEIVYRIKANVKDDFSRTYDEMMGEGFINVSSCKELQERFTTYATPIYYNRDMEFDGGILSPMDAPTTGAAEEKSSSASADDYSSTNVQVSGVDEADIIKNDGKYIYLIKGDTIRIVDAYPAENMTELVRLRLGNQENESFYPSEMYVDGNMLVVIGSLTSYADDDIIMPEMKMVAMPSYYGGNMSRVYILDITNRSSPTITRTVDFDGTYHTSRKIGNTLYTVLNRYVGNFYPMPYWEDNATNENVNSNPDDIMPKMKDSKTGISEMIAPCSDVRILPRPQNLNYLITAAIPLADTTQDVSRTVIVGNSDNVYASTNNMYIAANDYRGSYFRYFEPENTLVYKFTLGDGTITYDTMGSVKGHILNQFSMDEFNNHFRIATTSGNTWDSSNPSSNNLYILNSDMETVGKIEGIAPGESIYSTRFLGNRAYMVTFLQIDPLFVIDTTDPKNPVLAGKLKIPGYSTYLHPYDENHIMGFGSEVDASIDADKVHGSNAVYYTAVQGMKIGMFDVTDLEHPTEMFKEVIGDRGTTSDLLYNHKALLFDKSKNLLAFPITVMALPQDSCSGKTYSSCPDTCEKQCVPSNCTLTNGMEVCTTDCDGPSSCISSDYQYPKTVFAGAYIYNVDLANGFQFKGKITHFSSVEEAAFETDGYVSDYDKIIQRIIYIGENLYTISSAMVKANSLSTLAEKKAILLGGE